MKRLRKIALYLLIAVAVGAVTFFIPYTERLDGPKVAELSTHPDGADFAVAVYWYDIGLNAERFQRELDFDAGGRVSLPAFDIPTSLGRVLKKRVLTQYDKWSECENCYGPTAFCSLVLRSPYNPPEKMRLIQNRINEGGTAKFRVSVIPDERQFEPRTFAPADVPALLTESRAIIANGDSLFTEPALFGPQLRLINPVRVEVFHGALVLWMGGNVGYAVVPDSDGCPAMNRAMTSAT